MQEVIAVSTARATYYVLVRLQYTHINLVVWAEMHVAIY